MARKSKSKTNWLGDGWVGGSFKNALKRYVGKKMKGVKKSLKKNLRKTIRAK